jgi:hypothetical protein
MWTLIIVISIFKESSFQPYNKTAAVSTEQVRYATEKACEEAAKKVSEDLNDGLVRVKTSCVRAGS